MLKLKLSFLFCALLSFSTLAQDVKPSEESLKKLLEVTEARKMVDSMFAQIDGMTNQSIKQNIGDKVMTDAEKKAISTMRSKTVEIMEQELSWGSFESSYLQIYRDTFTQEEIDGMLVFYSSPAGKAVIKKMPLLMQKSMGEVQKRMGPLMQKLTKIQKETFAELKK